MIEDKGDVLLLTRRRAVVASSLSTGARLLRLCLQRDRPRDARVGARRGV
jgi:hypothetical protein